MTNYFLTLRSVVRGGARATSNSMSIFYLSSFSFMLYLLAQLHKVVNSIKVLIEFCYSKGRQAGRSKGRCLKKVRQGRSASSPPSRARHGTSSGLIDLRIARKGKGVVVRREDCLRASLGTVTQPGNSQDLRER